VIDISSRIKDRISQHFFNLLMNFFLFHLFRIHYYQFLLKLPFQTFNHLIKSL